MTQIAELSKGYDPTVVRSMAHYSQFADVDSRNVRLKNLNDIPKISD